MNPRKYCAGVEPEPPEQRPPPPLSHPASIVSEKAALSSRFDGESRYFTSMLLSLCSRIRSGFPSVSRPQYSFESSDTDPVGRHRIWKPSPGVSLNMPYDCQPLITQNSVFSFSVGEVSFKKKLKN